MQYAKKKIPWFSYFQGLLTWTVHKVNSAPWFLLERQEVKGLKQATCAWILCFQFSQFLKAVYHWHSSGAVLKDWAGVLWWAE
jgi:hypothetical protein